MSAVPGAVRGEQKLRGLRLRLADARGVTIIEMLVVLAILGVILAGMTTLFLSASTSQIDQSNRYQAQHNARLALDALRREIRCASGVTSVSTASLTIALPGYCQKPPTATEAPFTWCTVGAAPYALWRYSGSSCAGTGTRRAESLSSNSIFTYNRSSAGPALAAPVVSSPGVVGGYFQPGTYAYDVTAVIGGVEVSGTVQTVTVTSPNPSLAPSQITLNWAAPVGVVTNYKVYGRDNGSTTAEGLRLLKTLPSSSTSYPDFGAAFESMASPPLGTVTIALELDLTLSAGISDGKQRFLLSDDVVLRNSGRR